MSFDSFSESKSDLKSKIWIRRPSEKSTPLPVRIEKAGYAVWGSTSSFRRNKYHREFTIEYVAEGNIEIFIEGKKLIAEKGTIYILPPGKEHFYRTGSNGKAIKRFAALSGTELLNILPVNQPGVETVIKVFDAKKTANIFRKITEILEHQKNPDEKELSILAYSLLLETMCSMKNKYPNAIGSIIDYMTENLGRHITIETIAEENYVSVSTLNKMFQKYTGTPPYRFFLDKKLQWAEQLLLNTSMSIKEVAYKTGFENPLYFSNSFSKKHGLSPNNYRKSYSI